MTTKKIIGISLIVVIALTVAPLILSFVDMTYHWLLLVTLPIGGFLALVLFIIWIMMSGKKG